MTGRRSRGEGTLFWHEARQRWIASTTVGYDGRGKRVTRSASGRTKTAAKNKLREMLRDQEDGIKAPSTMVTVKQAVEDWLAFGLPRRSDHTVDKCRTLSDTHIVPKLGARRLRDLSASEVDRWLAGLVDILSTRSIRETRSVLSRAVKRAMARDLVRRNVVELTEVPKGRPGRRSKSLTAEQVDDALNRTVEDRVHHYIVLSLLTGARTEELRALRWEHVHLEGVPDAKPSIPPYLEVWRSVRDGGDTKTKKSKRTLALPAWCVEALRKQRAQQAADRLVAGASWQETGLVFTTRVGTEIDAANMRRDFRRALALVPGIDPEEWTPRELRHSFVSVLSDAGVPLEAISQLVGHSGTAVTELVYRHQLRPVIQTGATVMDQLFSRDEQLGSTGS
jgi:integrase